MSRGFGAASPKWPPRSAAPCRAASAITKSGRSGAAKGFIIPAAASSTPASPQRAVYMESFGPYFTYRWHPLQAIVRGQRKLIVSKTAALYDLAVDPDDFELFKLGFAIFVVVVVGILVTAWLVGDQGNLPFDYEGFD